MTLHLDTNAVIAILKNHPVSVRRRFRSAVSLWDGSTAQCVVSSLKRRIGLA